MSQVLSKKRYEEFGEISQPFANGLGGVCSASSNGWRVLMTELPVKESRGSLPTVWRCGDERGEGI